ncbi:MAG: hypothetical protein A2570_01620 [Candidatus Brennerbacteria bacterium RIFOXYD1_FULL_41_16]|uniref:Uncharacterized protein n=1 Tax=Candidatus Brennerbacteria bacterium RIFOXYD1_FULL_41_16 TaxID=1797529 RepID=A0A1G1XL11_9BACT|nr:MAG: hypothetical protein A2570_01620 [Candidatus Brennerbacteria bacterium RIFOXYD1_FULL_41_16]
MRKTLFKIWKVLLVPVSILFLIHFLKDITQDVLRISSFLDVLGDIKEDLSGLKQWQLAIFYWAWVNQFLLQPVLAFLVLKILKNRDFSRTDILVAGILIYFTVLFYWSFNLVDYL